MLAARFGNSPALSLNNNDTSFAHSANQLQTYHGTLIERRLDSIKKDVPLDYNEFVQTYIDLYAANRDEMAHVIGLSKYYFPIYEKAFRDAGIPEEIEYLSIVESKLDPNAVSRVGATGPWQFMTTTAKLYGLNMDDYVDERRDPVRASYAAAAYLKDAYEEFGDWLVAIASYNCGKSNIENAIAKAGASDFWSIRQYLPPETRNYVPAYIAVAYIMHYYSKHNIVPEPCSFSLNIDTVVVDRSISLYTIANVLNVDSKLLMLLNPSYRMQTVNGSPSNPRKVVIPQCSKSAYTALYNLLNGGNAAPVPLRKSVYAPAPAQQSGSEDAPPAYHKAKRSEALTDISSSTGHNYVTYRVKAGDTLSFIASKFDGSSVEKIKSLNRLKKEHLQPGMMLKISRG